MRLLLLPALILASAGGPSSRARAQIPTTACDSSPPLRVETVAEAGALGAAVNCTGGGTVEVVWAGAVTLTAPIAVGAGTFLSITGEDDSAEVRGGGQTRMFYVSTLGGLTLTDLKLSGGSAASGGAIHSSMATVALNSCVFDGNFATAGDGGAVRAEGGELAIVGGEFSGNSASGNGGAVLAIDAGLVIRNGTRFAGNRAVEGGGLYCGGGVNSTLLSAGATAFCSLSDATFEFNNASSETILDYDAITEPWVNLYGGGGVAVYRAVVDITDSEFQGNYAQLSGGALYGGTDAAIAIDGCWFENNFTPGHGAAVAASSATLGGSTVLTNNLATQNGGGVFGWDTAGRIEFSSGVVCSTNLADEKGGCFYTTGGGTINNGTVMRENISRSGGCLYALNGSDVTVHGGEFRECQSTRNGGFAFASDGSVVTIKGGTVTDNVAARRGGAVYCSGNSLDMGGSRVTIEGGTFSNNRALELGGGVAAWGTPTVVTVTGGVFHNNSAKYFGGFIFLEEEASLSCEGAFVQGNTAGDQGGGIYARDATWVNSSCDLLHNEAPQGAAAFFTNIVEAANLQSHTVTHTVESGGGVVYATETSVIASGVSFQSGVILQEDSSNSAIQLEGGATLIAKECVFGGWMGDSVIQNANPAEGSLVLDSCDFGNTSAGMVVTSPNSDARIRNALLSDLTIENAAVVNSSLALVDRALGCDNLGICGSGECVDSAFGVLCECLEDGECLGGGGTLSIVLKTPPPDVTYSPDLVYFELLVSTTANGSTPIIWNLTFGADELFLQVLPSSGMLPPGEDATVLVTGSPQGQEVGGDLVSQFIVTSVGTSNSATDVDVEVYSAFYLCQAFEYAMPVDGEDTTFSCEQCASVNGAEGLDCEIPGATLASLPVREGYWRSGGESLTIHQCSPSSACVGAAQISSAQDYCGEGYQGPYCAVCAEGFGRGAGNSCHSCEGTKSRLLIAAGSLFALVILLLIILTVAYLVGGLDAVEGLRRSLSTSFVGDRSVLSGRDSSSHKTGSSSKSIGRDRLADSVAPTFKVTSEVEERGAEGAASRKGVTSVPVSEVDVSEMKSDASSDTDTEDDNAPPMVRGGGQPGCCGHGEKIKRWAARLPMDKIKILVVVWQILSVFPSITAVDFPPAYARFLSWINMLSFDLEHVLSASCVFPVMDFYQRLLVTTLVPLGVAMVLVLTYWMAKRRAGSGSAGALGRRAAWSRHVAAGLLLSFLVFIATSTMAFKTFACDDEAVEGESYLGADYGIQCHTDKHTWYKVYAGIMILSLNPPAEASTLVDSSADERKTNKAYKPKFMSEDLEEKLEKRRRNPDLVPSMFLWKDFGPDMYYYEVVECGRRILLTGVLIFISPNTAAQVAAACMFAFVSLLGFELLRPHLDPVDSWLYRLGCMCIFLSNFLALLIKVDSAGDSNRDVFGWIMIVINLLLIMAVLLASWFSMQQTMDEYAVAAGTLLAFEQLSVHSVQFSRTLQAPASGRPPRPPPVVPACRVRADTKGSAGTGRFNASQGYAPAGEGLVNVPSAAFAEEGVRQSGKADDSFCLC
ncbi:Polymorphic membrane protein [Ectocarpus siliculosus]|uniref:Polymorphic membrane protein n=1 Tax=Ectocarpus siliculosus TaxID=2880 RepID=D7FRH3_ECTSI|nr:Polymorphic membrane protein [Ectocarpus siliculosus]|eukprot:CBJ30764.1 Polymorphic membrane protein [Ectocarpus siliculosus]